jgi:hypothetical protein
MKQTAVEWLAKYKGLNTKSLVFEQAKELEKEQLRECYHFAQIEQQKEFSSIYVGMSFEKWYKQNYD